MPFELPNYNPPNLTKPHLKNAPIVEFKPAPQPGVAPLNYHATTVYPEYFHMKKGEWQLIKESRMDCVAIQNPDGSLDVKEFRNLKQGELVACGRKENGEQGIYVHTKAFSHQEQASEKFAFRSKLSRETSFSIDYDELYDLLDHEQRNGFIIWVLGPALVFDFDSRNAFVNLIKNGYVDGLLAGNALATHDLEGAVYKTALGQEIYSKETVSLGHYNHLDTLNRIRAAGSIEAAIAEGIVNGGVMEKIIEKKVPFILAGSIRDDGPLPEVIGDAYKAQDEMRKLARKATTIIALATQLHTIAVGNMAPSYHITKDNRVRPVYFYTVDMSEFAVNKLANRGSLTARSILTNVQDFIVTVERGVMNRRDDPDRI